MQDKQKMTKYTYLLLRVFLIGIHCHIVKRNRFLRQIFDFRQAICQSLWIFCQGEFPVLPVNPLQQKEKKLVQFVEEITNIFNIIIIVVIIRV